MRRSFILTSLALLAGCVNGGVHLTDQRPVGLTLLFLNVGTDSIGVKRFDPDGARGPVPGALGAGGEGAQMSFLPGDSQRGMPQFVEVEWSVTTIELADWWRENISNRSDKYSAKWNEDYEDAMRHVPRHTRRIDLTPIVTPSLIEQVRADRANTQLKLTIRFNNDQVAIEARAEKWRR